MFNFLCFHLFFENDLLEYFFVHLMLITLSIKVMIRSYENSQRAIQSIPDELCNFRLLNFLQKCEPYFVFSF